VFLITLSVLLRANRSSFDRRSYPLTSPRNLRWLLATAATLLAVTWLGALLYEPVQWLPQLNRLDPHLHVASFARGLLAMALTFLAWQAWSWFSLPAPALQPPDDQALQRARRFYSEVACTSYSFLSLMGDKHLLLSEDARSLIQYGIKRHHLVALGDPACAVEDLPQAIDGLRRFTDSYNLTPVFYQVDERHLYHYHEAGFRLLKLGESARVHLPDFTLKGKASEKLRTPLNQGRRSRLQFERLEQPLAEATWRQLEAISDAWLEDKQMSEIGFSLGSFDRAYLAKSPMAVVKRDGGIIAFASLTDDFGRGEECGIDLMRHLTDVPNGVMDFLFVNLLQQARDRGYRWFDLGMAPLSGVGRSPWSPRDERLLKLIYEFGNRFYNYKGLRRYKEKFRPQWNGKYLAYPRGHALAPILLDVTALITGGYWRALRGR
jgi:phosphatidylglycerol lysyltransferase